MILPIEINAYEFTEAPQERWFAYLLQQERIPEDRLRNEEAS